MTNRILAVSRPKRPEMPEPSEEQAKKPEPVQKELKPRSKDSDRPSRPSKPRKGGPNRSSRPSKPRKVKPQPLVEVAEAANPEGVVFKAGDQILVRAPWGDEAVAEVTVFYQLNPESVVAQFIPKSEKSGWIWEGGCIRAELLRPADENFAGNGQEAATVAESEEPETTAPTTEIPESEISEVAESETAITEVSVTEVPVTEAPESVAPESVASESVAPESEVSESDASEPETGVDSDETAPVVKKQVKNKASKS